MLIDPTTDEKTTQEIYVGRNTTIQIQENVLGSGESVLIGTILGGNFVPLLYEGEEIKLDENCHARRFASPMLVNVKKTTTANPVGVKLVG